MTTEEPLYAYVQRVWVARDHDERDEKMFVVEQIKSLEAELDRLLAARKVPSPGAIPSLPQSIFNTGR